MLPYLGVGALLLGICLGAAFGAHMGMLLYGTGGWSTRVARGARNVFLVVGLVLFALCCLAGVVDRLT